MKNSKFKVRGNGNTIDIAGGITRLKGCHFIVDGSNCKIKIGKDSNINDTTFYLQDDDCVISIGEHVTISGMTELAVIEGRKISIGDDCLFSDQIEFRVGDSNSILDRHTKQRINPSKDITIGNHVWIGHGVRVLKGTSVAGHCIIATGAILTGKSFPQNTVVGGIPAKVLRSDVDWCSERI